MIESAASLGAQLRQAREAKELTLQDVSNHLRFSTKQIEALENNQFDAFPDGMMARGFIRSYAKYLGVDAEPLLDEYRANTGDETQKVIVVKSSMRPVALTEESWPWLKYILATIVILLFLLAWMLYVEFMPEQTSAISGQTSTGLPMIQQDTVQQADDTPAASDQAALPEVALPSAERATEADTAASVQDITTAQPSSAPADAAGSTAAAPAVDAVQTAQAVIQPDTAVNGNAQTIRLSFTGQSWVSVTDKTGKLIYEKLAQRGADETVAAVPPVTVVIGNATDTKLQYRGQAIDLSANTKNNVARITLE